MLPAEFVIRLQHGIAGGFAPPTPSAIYVLSRSKDHPAELVINSAVRQDGTPSLSDAEPKKIPVDSYTALIEELHSILKEIPVESPPGIQDIYGLDTSIAWGSEDLQWRNGGPSGCGSGYSEIQASEEDKKKFIRAVEIVNELITKES
ncbi:hypothetical protein JB92DRAFT_3018292 [Gautieria morchelliformis]|nr:hypothetical protein JB92DRAFT_3018292 [Gautieria morchelliformis]